MRRHSFFLKLFLGNLLLVGAIVALGAFLSYRELEQHFSRETEAGQTREIHILRGTFERLWPMSDAEIDKQCKSLLAGERRRVTVIATDGRVLGDSDADPAGMENHRTKDRPEVLAALEGEESHDTHASRTLQMRMHYHAAPIMHKGQIVGVVRNAMPSNDISENASFIRAVLGWSAVSAVVTAAILGVLISWIWYSPLRQITQTARDISRGDLSARAPAHGAAELVQLANALNEMRTNIATQIRTIATQRENLHTVVSSLGEGVIATDAKGIVTLVNQAALHLLGVEGGEAPVGQHVHNVVKILGVVDLYNQAQNTGQFLGKQIQVELEGQRRYLVVDAGRLTDPKGEVVGGLLVVHDVTDIARTAAVKAEFVANASHELRTPLATIRAAVDSLACIEPDDADAFKKFMTILDRHVTRLEDMTRDLLDLHLIESGRTRLRMESISFESIAHWVEQNFHTRASAKDLSLATRIADGDYAFTADRTLLELILQNLIENAIKFTPAGGSVTLELGRQDDMVMLRVSDSGCGIPPQSRARVFERFFQVDAARSGEPRIRGTGLGLAIVKHAADRLHANVELASEVGKGTSVTVLVPPVKAPE